MIECKVCRLFQCGGLLLAHLAHDCYYLQGVVDHVDITSYNILLLGPQSAKDCICEQNLAKCPSVPQTKQV